MRRKHAARSLLRALKNAAALKLHESLGDCTLILSDAAKTRLPAIRYLLATWSGVFQTMLDCEADLREIPLSDETDVSSWRAALDFMASGVVPPAAIATPDRAERLLAIADKYAILQLVDTCVDAIIADAGREGGDVSLLLKYVPLVAAQDACLASVARFFHMIPHMEAFTRIEDASYVEAILRRFDLWARNEEHVFEALLRWVRAARNDEEQAYRLAALPTLLVTCIHHEGLTPRTRMRPEWLLRSEATGDVEATLMSTLNLNHVGNSHDELQHAMEALATPWLDMVRNNNNNNSATSALLSPSDIQSRLPPQFAKMQPNDMFVSTRSPAKGVRHLLRPMSLTGPHVPFSPPSPHDDHDASSSTSHSSSSSSLAALDPSSIETTCDGNLVHFYGTAKATLEPHPSSSSSSTTLSHIAILTRDQVQHTSNALVYHRNFDRSFQLSFLLHVRAVNWTGADALYFFWGMPPDRVPSDEHADPGGGMYIAWDHYLEPTVQLRVPGASSSAVHVGPLNWTNRNAHCHVTVMKKQADSVVSTSPLWLIEVEMENAHTTRRTVLRARVHGMPENLPAAVCGFGARTGDATSEIAVSDVQTSFDMVPDLAQRWITHGASQHVFDVYARLGMEEEEEDGGNQQPEQQQPGVPFFELDDDDDDNDQGENWNEL